MCVHLCLCVCLCLCLCVYVCVYACMCVSLSPPHLVPLRHALADVDDHVCGLVHALLHLIQCRLHHDVRDRQHRVTPEERVVLLVLVGVWGRNEWISE